MKQLITILLLAITVNCSAQFTSYSESKDDVLFSFNLLFTSRSNHEISQKWVLSAKDNFELTEQMGPFKNLKPVLEKAFELADCENCEQVSEKLTNNPINYIFDVIEYQDVFLVTEFENQYKVIRYQPGEE